MAINIGSNFSFQGQQFLDDRQGIAKTKRELLNWNLTVPEGFEVCCEGVWYTYQPKQDKDPETGYFHQRDEQLGTILESVVKETTESFNPHLQDQGIHVTLGEKKEWSEKVDVEFITSIEGEDLPGGNVSISCGIIKENLEDYFG